MEKSAKKTRNDIDEFVISLLKKLKWPVLILILASLSTRFLQMSDDVKNLVNYFVMIFATFWSIRVINKTIQYVFNKIEKKRPNGEGALFPIFYKAIALVIWIVGIIFVISNLGYTVTPLITGLGVGGIAIALAVQNILGDLLSSISIYLDKPFRVGDFIIVGNLQGTVKYIGLKTTRVISLSGEELIIPNKTLVDSTIQNFKRMQRRRVLFELAITYETPPDKLKKLPGLIKNVISKTKNVEFGRAHFAKLATDNLCFEVVYYVLSNDYDQYKDIQQSINYGLMDAFHKSKIEFAYPTQKVFIKK